MLRDRAAEPGAAADRRACPKREPAPRDEYINAGDLFYWMVDEEEADIPLEALGIDIPLCCRFCI